ncbi:MAG: glutamate racemase [Sulfurimonas sp.]|nr:glutamate racemase [Sulfurimonas sp.]
MKVGVFDSGIGGLSVVRSLLEHELFEEIIYFGDTARVPYGIKDKTTIIRYAIEAVEFFKKFDIDLIIVACNSVSAHALDEMREHSSSPVIGVVESGILATANALKSKASNILVLGTKATINSKAYEIGLREKEFKNIESKATGLFVPLVEEEVYEGDLLDATLKHYFKDLNKPDAIILGCTHFPLISKAIKNYFGSETILIHSGDAIVEYLECEFKFPKRYKKAKLRFFSSENTDALKNTAKKWLLI